MSVLLRARDLCVRYGHVEAVKGVNFHLDAGEITALVGANGAGKTSILMALSGLLRPARGHIEFAGEDISALPPHQIVRRGLVQVAEGRAMLNTLTVRENLDLGAYTCRDRVLAARTLAQVYALFPVLERRAAGLAGNLSGGEQQMLAIGRALMAQPRLLLLDEPSMGLAPLMVREIFRVIGEIAAAGVTVLLVEQNVRQALKLARHGYVLENGVLALAGSGAQLLHDPRVVEAYLGG
jgi:branched-chain amino acid transport system ATP-binding protein